MDRYLHSLPRPFFVLAPMYDVTDTVFRQIIAETSAPDLFFTEFVNVDGLQSAGRDKLIFRLRFLPKEKPIIAQIWGKNPENFKKTANELVEMGFSGIDINMGCPDKAVIKNGCCSALINDHELATKIIEATKEGAAGRVPISVKTRIGTNEYNPDWFEFLFNQNLDMLSVHLRTVREMSKVPAHWELMTNIRELRDKVAPGTLLLGNGDVMTKTQGMELAKKHGIDGVMIGTGIFKNPYAFAAKNPWSKMDKKEKLKLYKKHVQLFAKTWKNNERPIVTLNKFCKIYVNDFDGAKELRENLMNCRSTDELIDLLETNTS